MRLFHRELFLLKHITIDYCEVDNKKVLLRERKRHTVHRVTSTPSVVLAGGTSPILTWPGGGVPHSRTGGYPILGSQHPDPTRGVVRHPRMGGGRGYPLPGCGLTNKLKLLPSLILRMTAVITKRQRGAVGNV